MVHTLCFQCGLVRISEHMQPRPSQSRVNNLHLIVRKEVGHVGRGHARGRDLLTLTNTELLSGPGNLSFEGKKRNDVPPSCVATYIVFETMTS